MPNTKIMTFLNYKSIFSDVEKNGLILPVSYLDNNKNLNDLIDSIIKNFDNFESVGYSSFLNAITQTCLAEESEKLGLGEIKNANFKHVPKNGIIFHRDNLLFFIAKSLLKECGDLKITGQKTYKNAQNYYKALLLISQLIPDSSLEKDFLLRAYPYYYVPQTSANIYEIRLQRYWYIYNDLLAKLDNSKKNHIQCGIKEIEKKANLSLKEYFHVVSQIYVWFLKIPNIKRKNLKNPFQKLGFNYKNIDSFYIRKDNFGEDSDFLNLINHLSLGLEEFKEKMCKSRKDSIDGFYQHFQSFFDNPVFKINDENYCIIDLKFLLEGICSGFMWHINNYSEQQLKLISEQYGYLLEYYFLELLEKIFGKNNIKRAAKDGQPDAILETDEYILVIEFTTEYYRFSSLYNEKTDLLKDDLHRLLFNSGKNDAKARNKKDKGKFFKLQNYIENIEGNSKTIIPILVTENYLGDLDLLNRFDSIITEGIKDNNLQNLKDNKPILLNIDDFELFWQIANSNNSIKQFAECVRKWEENIENKGRHHFNFSFFSSEDNKDKKINSEFKKFFNFQSLIHNLSSIREKQNKNSEK